MKFNFLLFLCALASAHVSAADSKPAPAPTNGVVSAAAQPLVARAVAAIGGTTVQLRWFSFKDRVLLGATDTGFGAKRESVLDAPAHWWLKTQAGYSERKDEPAVFLVWAWTLRALTDAGSSVDVVPVVKDGDTELWGLRVSGSVKPAMELYFVKGTDLLARIDWRSDIHRFSDWKTHSSGVKYPARIAGHKKADNRIWYFDDVLEVMPLAELPEKLRSAGADNK